MADISSPGGKGIKLESGKDTESGILQSTLSPKYLHTNSTSHTWPFSAIAELIDNAYDPDVKATQFWMDKLYLRGKTCLSFTDNGFGMNAQKLHKMLSFGFCEKVAEKGHMPVGHYGNGFKSGSMRLGKDALVLTKKANSKSIGYLSQTYLQTIQAETVVVPIATWDKKENDYIIQPAGAKALEDILKHSLLHSEEAIGEEFDKIPGHQGTRIIISNIRKSMENKHEFDFVTDEHDIRIPDDASTEGGKYRQTKRQNHIPECDYSLKAYCAILYLKPRMQIILRGKKVKTQNVEKSLSGTEVDRYKPQVLADPVKVVFGFNSFNKNHYGIMMYHRNRLIKPYERVGYQLRANNLGVGVVGVVQCDFLQPTHNKQDFDYTKAYRACMSSLGIKLNEYWNEKKGAAKTMTMSASQPLSEPEQSLPDHIWVQCDEPTCLKWRKLPDYVDQKSLPDKWYCHMNPDVNYKSCDIPEEKDDDTTPITPYAKVQRKRLERELLDKNKREKEAKLLLALEQEQKARRLKEKEVDLKKREESLNKIMSKQKLQDTKPKIKAEGAKVPMAQVSPRPTATKPLHVVTPTANRTPTRHLQSIQSTQRSPLRSNQSTPNTQKFSQSPSCVANQLNTHHGHISQPRTIAAKPVTPPHGKLLFSSPIAVPVNTSPTSPPPVKIVTKPHSVNLKTGQVSFKVVKSLDKTFLVQENIASLTPCSGMSVSSPTVTKVLHSCQVTNKLSPSNIDIKPKLAAVLPKPQTPSVRSTANDRLITGIKRERDDTTTSPAKKPKIMNEVIVIDPLPNEEKQVESLTNSRIIQIGKEAKNMIDKQRVELDLKTTKLIKVTREVGVKTRELTEKTRELDERTQQLKEVRSDLAGKTKERDDKTRQLTELQTKFAGNTRERDGKTQQLKEVRSELTGKTRERDEKTQQLTKLRANVCMLLQVLVPEIDVDVEEGENAVDELLRQVLEANQ